jgi:hypothetical protein
MCESCLHNTLGGCGDCHGATGAEMTTDGSGLCIACFKNADLPKDE